MILHKQNLLHLILIDLNVIFPKYHRKYHEEMAPQWLTEDDNYILAYHIGGFWNLLTKWISEDCEKTPNEMALIVEQMFFTRHI